MIHDLEKGEIDIALLWGPIAGYYAKHSSEKLTVTPCCRDGGARMAFRIGFGVRHSDQNWKRELNTLVAQNKAELERILLDYGVPLLDECGTSDHGCAMNWANPLARGVVAFPQPSRFAPSPAIAQAPPEPETYRLDDYHAPTPATLKGATVLDTPQAFELWSGKKAVFIDALSRPPKPEGLPKNAVWRDPKRFDIPGSIWLPDTGFGELSEPMARYFEQGLDARERRRQVEAARLLLPHQLLGVVERRETRAHARLHQCAVVSARRRRLGAGWGIRSRSASPSRASKADFG